MDEGYSFKSTNCNIFDDSSTGEDKNKWPGKRKLSLAKLFANDLKLNLP